jgi:hypothetical protein
MSRNALTSARAWDFVSLPPGTTRPSCALGGRSLSFDLGDPLRDRGDRLAFVQQRSVALESPLTGADLFP